MWLLDGENHLPIGTLVQKISDAEKLPGQVGSVGRVAQAEKIPIFSENSLGLQPR